MSPESEALLLDCDTDERSGSHHQRRSRSPNGTYHRHRHKLLFGALVLLSVITYLVSINVFQLPPFGEIMVVVPQNPFTTEQSQAVDQSTIESPSSTETSPPDTSIVSPDEIPESSPTTPDNYESSTSQPVQHSTEGNAISTTLEKTESNQITTPTQITSPAPTNAPTPEESKEVATTPEPSDDETDMGELAETESTEEESYSSDFLTRGSNVTHPACKIPKLDPFHSSIRNISSEKYSPAKCRKKFSLMFEIHIGNESSTLTQLKSSEKTGWKDCCYKLVFRDPKKSDDDSEIFSKKCYPIRKKRLVIPPTHEFITIFCNSTTNSSIRETMVDAFALAPLKPLVEERLEKVLNFSNVHNTSKVVATEQINLVVLGLDAVSHMNFQRIMPKVHKYLIEQLSAYWLDGYTKIGDNTYPNLLAMLTAQTVNETEASCSKEKYYDDCPFIWKLFAKQGYRTAYGEDSTWMGIFAYLKNGFKQAPTDYYLRPISRMAEKHIKADKRGNPHICYGPRLSFEFLLNHMKSLASTMGQKKRYFQLIWATSLTHDYVNLGRMGEKPLLNFIQWMEKEGHLNNTAFLLTSDHGIRWGPMRSTAQGKVEENMPLFYILLPEWFRRKYASAVTNLLDNRARLTTPFDVHETFLDLLDLSSIGDDNLKKRTKELAALDAAKKLSRGISLFLPIPESRTCKVAEIAEHWCVCHSTKVVQVSDGEVQQAANYVVFALNSFVSKYPKCAYLALHSVQYALLVIPASVAKKSSHQKTFELSFRTAPGNATFDATVVRNKKNQWSVSGVISRTNLYGNQSFCVDSTDMKKYCYCLT